MKDLTTQFLDFLEADPDKVYDVGNGNGCAFQAFLTSIGFENILVGCYSVWQNGETVMRIPNGIWPHHFKAATYGSHDQTYGGLAANIRAARKP